MPLNNHNEQLISPYQQPTTISQLDPKSMIPLYYHRSGTTTNAIRRQFYSRIHSTRTVDALESGSNNVIESIQQPQKLNGYDEKKKSALRPRSEYTNNDISKTAAKSFMPSTNKMQYDAEQIKDQVDIISVIESYQLDQFQRTSHSSSRSTAIACCPFHDDRHPSFHIIDEPSSNLRMYQCFSCGAAGDVFNFVKEFNNLYCVDDERLVVSTDEDSVYDNVPIDDFTTNVNSNKKGNHPKRQQHKLSKYQLMTYGQAVRHVWENYVISDGTKSKNSIPFHQGGKVNTGSNNIINQYHQQRLILANIAAASFYCECLRHPSAGNARYYLRQRGLSITTITDHTIGYAPDCYYSRSGTANVSTTFDDEFVNNNFIDSTTKWGDGGLVHRLRQLGFTPTEIIDAGLAVRTKRYRTNKALIDDTKSLISGICQNYDTLQDLATINENTTIHVLPDTKPITTHRVNETAVATDNSTNNSNINISNDDDDYDSLIDRFRDRIMVPIFDSKGENVLGFGGRVIPQEEYINEEDFDVDNSEKNSTVDNITKLPASSSSFTPPKYINSPESIIFEKRRILFGQHHAAKDISTNSDANHNKDAKPKASKSKRNSGNHIVSTDVSRPSSLIIVEGYLDAIVLRAAGIRNVVATMGTSVSLEQLQAAANTLLKGIEVRTKASTQQQQSFDGIHRIILCLDNDNAGIAATERICSNGMILDTIRQCADGLIDFYIAPTFNSTIKDPAEYVDTIKNDVAAGGSSKAKKKSISVSEVFHSEIVSRSTHWVDWYLERIVQRYDPVAPVGTLGSISDIIERCSTLIAQACNHPSDRVPKITRLANNLATILTNATPSVNTTTIANRPRHMESQDVMDCDDINASFAEKLSPYNLIAEQLYIDLADRVSHFARIHRSNEVLRSREQLNDFDDDDVISPATSIKTQWKETNNVIVDLANGVGPESRFDIVDEQKTSRAKKDFPPLMLQSELLDDEFLPSKGKRGRRKSATDPKRRQRIVRRKSLADSMKVNSITPHFSGFRFTHKSDLEWLNIFEDRQGRKVR
jgi:DNA primase